MVAELCTGGDLKEYILKKVRLNENEAIDILRHILCGFIELFKHSIIHRDIKPANILRH